LCARDQGASIALQRQLHDDTRIDLRPIHRPFRQHIAGDDAVMPIEPHRMQLFVQPTRKPKPQEHFRIARILQPALATQPPKQNRRRPRDRRILAPTTRRA
jgi:hypothetical protein